MDPHADSPLLARPIDRPRWRLFADVGVFWAKLALNGLCEVALAPAAIVAAVVGVFASPADPARHFRAVLRLGRRAEEWIGMFDALEPARERRGLDRHVARIERQLIDLEAEGGLTARARASIDAVLDRAARRDRFR